MLPKVVLLNRHSRVPRVYRPLRSIQFPVLFDRRVHDDLLLKLLLLLLLLKLLLLQLLKLLLLLLKPHFLFSKHLLLFFLSFLIFLHLLLLDFFLTLLNLFLDNVEIWVLNLIGLFFRRHFEHVFYCFFLAPRGTLGDLLFRGALLNGLLGY